LIEFAAVRLRSAVAARSARQPAAHRRVRPAVSSLRLSHPGRHTASRAAELHDHVSLFINAMNAMKKAL
jgi:hypothetical protein